MDNDQFKKRCPNSKYLGKGFLPDYKLAFTRYSRNWESAVANVLVSPGDLVWAEIYSITLSNIPITLKVFSDIAFGSITIS
jgi:hypothetical protein